MPTPKPEAFTVISLAEVVRRMGKSRAWVYRHADELGASRIGGALIFTEEGLAHAIQNSRREVDDASNRQPSAVKKLRETGRRKGRVSNSENYEARSRYGFFFSPEDARGYKK